MMRLLPSSLAVALRDIDRCTRCGKTRAVLNVAPYRGQFRAEPVSPDTHCTCAAAATPVVETVSVIECCEHCGEEQQRAEYYQSECRDEGEWINGAFIPGPSRGAHSFVKVIAAEPARRGHLARID